jgi:predicted nucleic acid-binding protein
VKLADALAGVRRLFIDTAPLIYFIEQHPVYLDRVRAIMQQIDAGEIAGVSSVVTLTEVLTLPVKAGLHDIQQAYRAVLLNSRSFTLVPIHAQTAIRAAELRARYSLKTPDALQVSAAIDAGCDAFLTNDTGIKRVQEISVLVLDEIEVASPGAA